MISATSAKRRRSAAAVASSTAEVGEGMILNGRGLPVRSGPSLDGDAKWIRDLLAENGIVPSQASAIARCLDETEYYAAGFKKELDLRRSVINYFF